MQIISDKSRDLLDILQTRARRNAQVNKRKKSAKYPVCSILLCKSDDFKLQFFHKAEEVLVNLLRPSSLPMQV